MQRIYGLLVWIVMGLMCRIDKQYGRLNSNEMIAAFTLGGLASIKMGDQGRHSA